MSTHSEKTINTANSTELEVENRLINFIRSNRKARNYLNDIITNAESIEEDFGIILPGIDFTGLDNFQISSVLANFESTRIFLREAAKNRELC